MQTTSNINTNIANLAKSSAHALLWQHGIAAEDVAEAVNVTPRTVFKALSLHDCGAIKYSTLIRVRMGAEKLLKAKGYAGEIRGLWDEYETALRQLPERAA